jgi:iron complex outermembrane receptor protein
MNDPAGKLLRLRPTAMAVAAAVTCMTSSAALAQDNRQLEEILVTTERRLSTEATTAISMEVLSPTDLASNQIKDIIDLQNAVPGLQFYQNGSYVQANVRGVGNPSTGGPSEQVGVPVFFDGATQGEEMALASGFFDVADVQVLRGPQATFVGQSAAGGAILINSMRPNFDGLNGFIEAQAGTYNQRKVHGAVNLPITDTFAARLAYMSDERDSFYTNISGRRSTGGESNVPGAQTDNNYRVTFLWEPTEKFTLFSKLERTHLEANGIPQQPNPRSYTGYWDQDGDPDTPSVPVTTWAPNFQGPMPGTGTLVPVDTDNDPDTPDEMILYQGVSGPGGVLYDPLDPFVIDRPIENWRIQKNNRFSVETNFTTDSGITFRWLGSWIQMDRLQLEGGNSSVAAVPNGFHLGPDMLTYSHEFNIISPEGQRLEWLIGAYRNSRHTELSLNISLANPDCGWEFDSSWTPCPTGTPEPGFQLYWTSTDDVDHQAIYGQLNYDLTDTLELLIEGRYNEDDNVQVRQLVFTPFQMPFGDNTELCPGQILGSTFYCPPGTGNVAGNPPLIWQGDIPTYKVGLNWEPRDGHFFYAFFARGYKSGQSTPFGANQIVEEVVDDFEIGWKGTVLDGRLYAELGFFSMDYTDMQMSAFRTSTSESDNAVVNIGDSTIEGIDGAIRLLVGGFGLNGSLSYVDSELGELNTIDTRALPIPETGGVRPGDTAKGCTGDFCFDYSPYWITLSGSENLFSPKVTYTFGIDYAFQLSSGGTLTPAVSLNHSDRAFSSILQQPGDLYYTTDDRDLVNFNLTYQKEDWTVQVFGTNVTDETFIEGVAGGSSVLYGDPEVWGVRARMDF